MLIFTESTRSSDGHVTESNKFYDGSITKSGSQSIVVLRWGRIGVEKGQTSQKAFSDEYSAKSYLQSKLYEKSRKGYRQVDESTYKALKATARLIGLQNKIHSTRWLERVTTPYNKILWKDVSELRLQEPDCFPGLEVIFSRKVDNAKYKFLFTSEGIFVGDANNILSQIDCSNFRELSVNDELSEVAGSVHSAIFAV